MLAKPSKMHRTRPLAVYPATLVPPREGACPEYKSSKSPPYNCQKTIICSLICVNKSLLHLQTIASLAYITYILLNLHKQEPTISTNCSKSYLYNPYTPMLTNK